MQVLGSKGGTMNLSMVKETYLKGIWKRRPGVFLNAGKSLLLLDYTKIHLGTAVMNKSFEQSSTPI